MKKIIGVGIIALMLGFSSIVSAQETIKEIGKDLKEDAVEAGQATERAAKKVGNKTAEVASKGKAKITDQVHKDKVGPKGETIYIDNHAQYYWVDEKGHRHYVSEARLKSKVKED